MTVYNGGCPAQLLDSLQHTTGKEDSTVIVILKELATLIVQDGTASEVVIVVDKVNLDACRAYKKSRAKSNISL